MTRGFTVAIRIVPAKMNRKQRRVESVQQALTNAFAHDVTIDTLISTGQEGCKRESLSRRQHLTTFDISIMK